MQATAETIRSDFSVYDPFFRSHYQNRFLDSGYGYERYEPAYRYGYDLATDERYHEQDWDVLEPEARRYWGQHHADSPWEQFKDAVRYGWQQVKHAVAG